MNFIEWFPDEVLLSVFQKVNLYTACILRLVNKQLYKISCDEDLQSLFRHPRISTRETHGACIQNGDLFMWGLNHFNRLMDHSYGYKKKMEVKGKKVSKVLTGHMCTIVLTEDKNLYIWGYHSTVRKELDSPQLLHPQKIINVQMAMDQSIAAVSEEGHFFLWENVITGDSKAKGKEIYIPDDRIRRAFFTPYIVGFVTEKSHIYISNYGCEQAIHLTSFCKIDWTEQDLHSIKDVIYWKNEESAIVLLENNDLYEVPIDYDYQIKDSVQCIERCVKKVLLSDNLSNVKLYILTYDGRIIKYNLSKKKKQIVVYAKKCMDFSVTKMCGGGEKIDWVDEQGNIQQCMG